MIIVIVWLLANETNIDILDIKLRTVISCTLAVHFIHIACNILCIGSTTMGEHLYLKVKYTTINNHLFFKAMGIPFRRLICASNTNNTLTEFINSGMYDIRSRQIQKTQSPAIDILKASNLERFLYHMSNRDHELVRRCFKNLEENQCFEVTGQVCKIKFNLSVWIKLKN